MRGIATTLATSDSRVSFDMTDRPTILVPIQVLEGETLPEGIPALLAHAHVVLLGYHVVPDQTAPGQARIQFEERATDRLAEFQSILEDAGATVETRLVFTPEKQQTLDRMVVEHDCLAVLIPHATKPPEDVLVAIRGTVGSDRIARLVAGLFANTGIHITLYHIVEGDESDEDAELLLDSVATRLVDLGMAEGAIDHHLEHASNPRDSIAAAATEYDTVVIGESEPSLVTYVFGMGADEVADQFLGPVLVVQREKPTDDEDSQPAGQRP